MILKMKSLWIRSPSFRVHYRNGFAPIGVENSDVVRLKNLYQSNNSQIFGQILFSILIVPLLLFEDIWSILFSILIVSLLLFEDIWSNFV